MTIEHYIVYLFGWTLCGLLAFECGRRYERKNIRLEYCSKEDKWLDIRKHRRCTHCFNHIGQPQHSISIVPYVDNK